jgi:hypothetical protein
VPDEERRNSSAMLQPGLVKVEVHPVDRLDLKQHMISQHVSGTTR